ncbi:MAG: chain length determinant protein EpsF [Pseudomonadota bacterium]
MNPQQFLNALLARKKIVLFVLSLTVLTTLLVSLIMPKTYRATSTLVLNYKGSDPVTGQVSPAQMIPGYMATQTDIITSRNVAVKVVDILSLAQNPAAIEGFNAAANGEGDIRDWLANELSRKLDVQPSHESSVINLSYESKDPKFAATLANAFAEAYIQTNLQLKIEPSRRAAEWFNEQVKGLRDNLAQAQNKLTSYQREKGIVSVDQRMDVENSRLAELSSQLVAAQAQFYDSNSRRRQTNSGKRLDENPDIISNPLIQSLKADLSRAEAKLADLGQRLNANHPQYQSALAEVNDRRQKLESELKTASSSLGSAANISQQRESSIQSSLAAQKARVLEISQQRDELSNLQSDVTSAQKALDVAMQRLSQTNLEGQANQSDVAVLNPAVTPLTPSKPHLFLNLIASIFVGTVLGLGFALLAEILDRRIRVPEDLSLGLKLPVLGIIAVRKPERKRCVGRRNHSWRKFEEKNV